MKNGVFQKKKTDDRRSLTLITKKLYLNRYLIVIGLLSLIVTDVLQLFIPRVIKRAVDDLTFFKAVPSDLLRYAGLIALIGLLISIFRFLWRRCLMGVSQKIEAYLRWRLFSHLQLMSSSYFDRKRTGDLMAHATNDIDQVRLACGMGLVALNDAVILGACAIGFMVYIHLELTLYVLIPMPLIVLGTRMFGRKMHFWYKEVQSAFSDLTESVRERFAGIRIIKAYTGESEASRQVEKISEVFISKNISLSKMTGAFFPSMVFLTNLSLFFVLLIGGRKTILGEITPGDFVAFNSYLSLLMWPMMALGWVTNLIQRGRASLERLQDIITAEPEIKDAPDAISVDRIEGSIEFDHVFFSYNKKNENVLEDISTTVEKGSILGIVGPQGMGKSTFLNLIPRLYDVTSGSIRIDGHDIRNIRLSDLRKHIVSVPQEPFLFAGTVRDNITFQDKDISEDKLIEVSRKAALYETVLQFPRQWDTLVGEKGLMLSGGQKQRIAFARALLKDAPIMIFDDPISQVDSKTAYSLIRTLKAISHEKTTFIVSHRVSAVRFADKIITLSDGRIIESGTHDSLSKSGGYYEKINQLQEIENEA